jgi:MFS family permease
MGLEGEDSAGRLRFRDVFAMGEFRALWIAEVLSVLGDQFARVALAVLVFGETSSASWTALAFALSYVPAMLGGVLLSGLADRYSRRELMVVTDLVRAVVAGAMALSFLPLPVLMGLVGVLAFARGPFKAAQLALLPTVLGAAFLTGLVIRHMSGQAAQLLGLVSGGLLLVIVDPYVALGVNAVSFLGAALVVQVGVRKRPGPRALVTEDGDRTGVVGALRWIWRDRRLRGLVAVSWLIGCMVTPEGLAAPYAATVGATVVGVGLLMAADPAGSIVGAWLAQRIPESSRHRTIVPLAAVGAVPLGVVVFAPGLWVSIGLFAVVGVCSTAYLLLAQEEYTRRVPDHRRGLIGGLVSSGVTASQGLVVLGAGVVADYTSPALAIASAGLVFAVLAVWLGLSWLAPASASTPDSSRRGESDEAGFSGPCPSSPAPPSAGSAAELSKGGS